MVYYKITSLTSTLSKRHPQKDANLNILYRDKFSDKSHTLLAGGSLYISSPSLPINLHKYRMDGLITIVEINKNTFMKLTNPTNIKKVTVEEPIVPVIPSDPKKISKK